MAGARPSRAAPRPRLPRAGSGRRCGRVMAHGRGDHVGEFRLVGGGHHREARQAGKHGKIEGARIGSPRPRPRDPRGRWRSAPAGPEGPRRAPPDHSRAEGRWNKARRERPVAFRRKACGEGHGMLLGNATSKVRWGRPVRTGRARCRGHGGSDGHHLVVAAGFIDQRLGEDACVAGGVGLGLHLRARHHVELHDGHDTCRRGFGGRIALALLRHHMDQDGAGLGIAHILQHRQQCSRLWPSMGPHNRSPSPRTACRRSRSRARTPPPWAAPSFTNLGRCPASCLPISRREI